METENNNKVVEDIVREYSEYLSSHISNVQRGYHFIKENIPEMLEDCNEDLLEHNIMHHDDSKFSKEEFMPYAYNFYAPKRTKEIRENFKKAWKHHYTHNKHHPEFWNGLDMPKEYIIEMICDWRSFSWRNNNLGEIFNFWKKAIHSETKTMSENTKKIMQEKLNILKNALARMDLL